MALPYSYEEWVRLGQAIPLRGGRAFYVRKGRGFPVVMLDYYGGNSWWFSRVLDTFAEEFTVYAVDPPGHGQSDTPAQPYGPPEYAVFLEEFMDRLGMAKAHVVGGHGSALTAVHLAANRPSRVAKLVLDGISAWTREEGAQQWAEWVRLGWVDENGLPRPLEKWGGVKVRFPGLDEEAAAAEALRRSNEDFREHGRWWASTMKEALKYDVYPLLHLVRAPTLMVNGEHEGVWVRRGETRVLKGIKGARLEIVAGTGSRPAFMRPDLFSKLVLDFLKTPG